ncbi:DoxX family membrane protein [Dawidia soli]|uniref:DoxX family membrane protein n=1 Tax=Dawidia soli TaxID=2782352 RepID=A0AAP2GID3_9BACT|nr:DoxX family membrane protein [Dawidia soli]MBT1686858.1 DoxX family membrane protein [Dawidia soli]
MTFKKIASTDTASTTILIRFMVGAVFLSEGIQKFLFAGKLSSGRFAKTGLPNPDFLGPFVGSFEFPLLSRPLLALI